MPGTIRTVLPLFAAALLCSSTARAQDRSELPSVDALVPHVIDSAATSTSWIGVADLDADLFNDVVVLRNRAPWLVWYENPRWVRHTIPWQRGRPISAAVGDVSGNGLPDLVVVAERTGKDGVGTLEVSWLENLGAAPGAPPDWRQHPIVSEVEQDRVAWVDLNWDGRQELLLYAAQLNAGEAAGTEAVRVLRVPDDPVRGAWEGVRLEGGPRQINSLRVVDWDGRDGDDLLVAGQEGVAVYLSHGGTDSIRFSAERVARGADGRRTASARLAAHCPISDRQSVAAIDGRDGERLVVFAPADVRDPLPWPERLVEREMDNVRVLDCVDLDGDGRDEIVIGSGLSNPSLSIFRYDPATAQWRPTSHGRYDAPVNAIEIADLNLDGWPDIVTAGAAGGGILWYEYVPEDEVSQ